MANDFCEILFSSTNYPTIGRCQMLDERVQNPLTIEFGIVQQETNEYLQQCWLRHWPQYQIQIRHGRDLWFEVCLQRVSFEYLRKMSIIDSWSVSLASRAASITFFLLIAIYLHRYCVLYKWSVTCVHTSSILIRYSYMHSMQGSIKPFTNLGFILLLDIVKLCLPNLFVIQYECISIFDCARDLVSIYIIWLVICN